MHNQTLIATMRSINTKYRDEPENKRSYIMAKEPKLSQSEIDGVQYRRAKLWQIILIACNALNGMAVYSSDLYPYL